MKINLFILKFLILFCMCEFYEFDLKNNKKEVVFDVTGDQICKGYFKPINMPGHFSVEMKSEDGSTFFDNKKLENNKETHFAFNITTNKDVLCVIEAHFDSKDKRVHADFELFFETQYDTFKKDVAKQVRVEPATHSLTQVSNKLHDMNNETDILASKMALVDSEHKKMFAFAVVLSIGTLLVYIGSQAYIVHSMRTFFKTKKLI